MYNLSMNEKEQNDKNAEEFLEFLNSAIMRRLGAGESMFKAEDFEAAHMLYDFASLQLTNDVMTLGVSEFARRQFFMGMMWEKYKITKDESGKFDPDLLNGLNLDGL